ncbi:hypothetical protein MarSH_425 [Marseillevirus Shanghai 1]|nr:hypothetical protein MarSH_425 [Marseillevirus Shanghai 1]
MLQNGQKHPLDASFKLVSKECSHVGQTKEYFLALLLAINKEFPCPFAKYFALSQEAKLREKQVLHSSLPQSFRPFRVSQSILFSKTGKYPFTFQKYFIA